MHDHVPAFTITVPEEFYWAVADRCGGEFADSYLFGGVLTARSFMPRTRTGWERLSETGDFCNLLNERGIDLAKPPIYQGPPAWKILGLTNPKAEKTKKRRDYD